MGEMHEWKGWKNRSVSPEEIDRRNADAIENIRKEKEEASRRSEIESFEAKRPKRPQEEVDLSDLAQRFEAAHARAQQIMDLTKDCDGSAAIKIADFFIKNVPVPELESLILGATDDDVASDKERYRGAALALFASAEKRFG